MIGKLSNNNAKTPKWKSLSKRQELRTKVIEIIASVLRTSGGANTKLAAYAKRKNAANVSDKELMRECCFGVINQASPVIVSNGNKAQTPSPDAVILPPIHCQTFQKANSCKIRSTYGDLSKDPNDPVGSP